jgi:hypothetical protein
VLGAFAPDQISGLIGWWESDRETYQDSAETTAAGDGDPVRVWKNLAGGVDLEAPAGSRRPTRTAAGVAYDIVDDRMDAIGLYPGATMSEVTIVCRHANPQTNGQRRAYGFGSSDAGTGTGGSAERYNLAPDPSIRFDGAAITGHTLSHPTTVFTRTTIRREKSTPGTFESAEWFDGTPALAYTSGGAGTGIVDDFHTGQVTSSCDALIRAIIIYSRSLTTEEREQVEAYVEAL